MKALLAIPSLLFFSLTSFAITNYNCTDLNKVSGNMPVTLTVLSSTSVQIFGKPAVVDSKYAPTQKNISFARFHFTSDLQGMYSDFLIEKTLLKDAPNGFIKNEDKSEGFAVAVYRCTKI